MNQLSSPSIFFGTTKECLEHFFQSSWNSEDPTAVMAEFCKVERKTAVSWGDGQHLPKGESLLRVRVFLTHTGYRPTEYEGLDRKIRDICELIAFGILSTDQLMSDLGYRINADDPVGSRSALYNVMLRGANLKKEKWAAINILCEKFYDQLNDHRLAFERQRLVLTDKTNDHPNGLGSSAGVVGPASVSTDLSSKAAGASKPEGCMVAIALMRSLTPHVSRLVGETGSVEERRQVRQKMGDDLNVLAEAIMVLAYSDD